MRRVCIIFILIKGIFRNLFIAQMFIFILHLMIVTILILINFNNISTHFLFVYL